MSYHFYVLYSLKDNRLYKGYTSEVGQRFFKHQAGGTNSTRHRRPLVLVYLETYSTKSEAYARERWAKSKEGGVALRFILKEQGILDQSGKLNFRISAA